MKRPLVGLGASVFNLYSILPSQLVGYQIKLLSDLDNSTLLYSTSIKEYYIKCGIDRNVIESYISNRASTYGKIQYDESYNQEDGLLSLLDVVAVNGGCLLAEKTDYGRCRGKVKSIKYVFEPIDWESNNHKVNPVKLYASNTRIELIKGESVNKLKCFFPLFFEGESKVVIIDKYISSENGINSFIKHYLPYIEKKARIVIVTKCESANDLSRMNGLEYSDSLQDYSFSYKDFSGDLPHDRYILVSGYELNIGPGIDVLTAYDTINNSGNCMISSIQSISSRIDKLLPSLKGLID